MKARLPSWSTRCATRSARIWTVCIPGEEDLPDLLADADPAIQALARQDPAWEKRLHPRLTAIAGEVLWAVRHEMARTVEDFLARRTRALLLDARASIAAAAAVAAIKHCGFACWAGGAPPPNLIGRFDDSRIPVQNVRHVRIWGLQVDDERELPGHERTSIPDEDIWQVTLRAIDGSRFEVNSNLLVAVSPD